MHVRLKKRGRIDRIALDGGQIAASELLNQGIILIENHDRNI